MRHITSHMCQGDPNAKAVIVQAEEELGPGGAPHYYRVRCINMSPPPVTDEMVERGAGVLMDSFPWTARDIARDVLEAAMKE